MSNRCSSAAYASSPSPRWCTRRNPASRSRMTAHRDFVPTRQATTYVCALSSSCNRASSSWPESRPSWEGAQHRLVRLAHVEERGAGPLEESVEAGREHGTLDLGDGGSLDGRDVVDRRRIAAERAGRVAGQSDLAHPGVERIDEQQPPHERLAGSEQQLERLGSLPGSDDAGQHPEHAALGTARNLALGRRLREEAAVARAAGRPEDRHLPVEAKDRPVDVRPVLRARRRR